jgi:2'-5' RNA ligase
VANLVIVAIPAENDPVWAVSSEKVPHLTVLFLGDAMSNPNVSKIVEYVKERARDLEPFSLLVDHRGVLGADEADVLFFTKDIPWKLVDFRETLKYNQEISMAYNAIPQHQDWKPHLTLGYPETPAKSDDWDPMVPQYVTFDKIAVWYGDSEGSEFVLSENPESQWREDSPSIAAWADTVGDIIAHYGVKGMKWGVRRSAQQRYAERQQGRAAVNRALGAKKSGQKREEHVERLQTGKANIRDHARSGGLFVKKTKKDKPVKEVSSDAAKASTAATKAKKQGKQALSNEEMQALVTRMNLEQQLTRLTPPSRTQKGAKFVGNLLVNAGKQQAQLVVNDQVNKQIKKALGSK